jgi:hypothetical protein
MPKTKTKAVCSLNIALFMTLFMVEKLKSYGKVLKVSWNQYPMCSCSNPHKGECVQK